MAQIAAATGDLQTGATEVPPTEAGTEDHRIAVADTEVNFYSRKSWLLSCRKVFFKILLCGCIELVSPQAAQLVSFFNFINCRDAPS